MELQISLEIALKQKKQRIRNTQIGNTRMRCKMYKVGFTATSQEQKEERRCLPDNHKTSTNISHDTEKAIELRSKVTK